MAQFVSPAEFMHSAGTWTQTNANNVWYARRTAANAAWVTRIPINPPQNNHMHKGAKVTSVEILFEVTVEAMDAVTATIYKAAIGADGATVLTATEVTNTYDTGHDAAAERIDADQHKMTLTITTPEFLKDSDVWYIEFSGDGGANGVFDFYGAMIHYTLRV
jgi:hypothetical protein